MVEGEGGSSGEREVQETGKLVCWRVGATEKGRKVLGVQEGILNGEGSLMVCMKWMLGVKTKCSQDEGRSSVGRARVIGRVYIIGGQGAEGWWKPNLSFSGQGLSLI